MHGTRHMHPSHVSVGTPIETNSHGERLREKETGTEERRICVPNGSP